MFICFTKMKIVKAFILLLFLSTIHNIGFAQNKDEQLASQFFSNGEYDKAAALYEKL
jgi:hypothetical protein